jgi:hypothetical protein
MQLIRALPNHIAQPPYSPLYLHHTYTYTYTYTNTVTDLDSQLLSQTVFNAALLVPSSRVSSRRDSRWQLSSSVSHTTFPCPDHTLTRQCSHPWPGAPREALL